MMRWLRWIDWSVGLLGPVDRVGVRQSQDLNRQMRCSVPSEWELRRGWLWKG